MSVQDESVASAVEPTPPSNTRDGADGDIYSPDAISIVPAAQKAIEQEKGTEDEAEGKKCNCLKKMTHDSRASRILQIVVRWLSLVIALLDIPAIVLGCLPHLRNTFAWGFGLTFLLGSLFVVMGTIFPRVRCVKKYLGYATDFCWPVSLYLFWQTSCLLHAPFLYCNREGNAYSYMCAADKINLAAFVMSCVDLVLGLVARFI